ncbi:FYVE, RhoGEF and PH domain-containing protein 4-like isoform X3 [Daphnia pulex]|nr:FYVE, RhoGEF and PH domain-containing protein 4-like isoform X3 [Daphnia pulex]XP_046449870.1 FYVE, RhoGEF and PH domain-containing protein 4-like isoform X3 [Daphnia pulex]XP_046449881.1 FYVE, RhoGEF and PH domain-containing protein 4-like isoform X3 [Daphnia pulex]
MERQKLRHHQQQLKCCSLDGDPIAISGAGAEESVITPPKDFQDHLADSCKITSSGGEDTSLLTVVVSGGCVTETILEPPAMFRPPAIRHRPRTELYWTAERPAWTPLLPAPNESTSQVFNEELERLKSHSLFLRFPLDGAARVHYRSSRSVVIQSASVNQYRIRTEETTEANYPSDGIYEAVSETESEEEDEETSKEEPPANRRAHGGHRVSAARLSSSSGLSSSQATTTSSTTSDADSGIDGISPRVSATAFGESTLSPSQSILYIDSISARNSVVHDTTAEEQPADDSTNDPEESSRLPSDEGSFNDPRASILVVEGDPRRDRAHRVAIELLHTERTYVDVLHLLDQVFQFRIDQENRAHGMFAQDLIPQMFSNIKSLFKLHHDFFLPRLEERLREWEEQEQQERRIGDIMTSFAPFLKMYAEYVRNFDHATNLISTMSLKSPRFVAIVDEIQQLPQCGHLSLQHHMLTPIQRVPRYEMLLRDYLRRLPEDSADRAETEKALHLVSTAANHANEAMKKIDQFKQLLEIQESLGGAVDLVSPTRELVKEGKIVKISARSGDHQERYLFLFTDLLLLCSPRLIPNRVIGGAGLPPYRVRARFTVSNVEVLEGDNLETANTFYLREGAKTVELYTGTQEEKEAWIDGLYAAMTELTRRKSSLRISPMQSQQQARPPSLDADNSDSSLGKAAPTLVRMDSVTRCFHCQGQFSVMKRKHHCYSCGRVACNRCSNHKLPLPYDSTKSWRVCDPCHEVLVSSGRREMTNISPVHTPDSAPSPPSLRSSLLEVDVETPSVLSGYLSLKTRGKTWQRRWFALRSDFVLYSYRSHQGESRAMTATPVPGFAVTLVSGSSSLLADGASPSHLQSVVDQASKLSTSNGDGVGMISERDRSFKMAHVHKSYQFQSPTRQEAEKWVQFLQMAAKADLPSPS